MPTRFHIPACIKSKIMNGLHGTNGSCKKNLFWFLRSGFDSAWARFKPRDQIGKQLLDIARETSILLGYESSQGGRLSVPPPRISS
jgi:hypothetical protein